MLHQLNYKCRIQVLQETDKKFQTVYLFKGHAVTQLVEAGFVRFQLKIEFCRLFSSNTQIPNFMKIRPVGAELFHTDGQTSKLIVVFRTLRESLKRDREKKKQNKTKQRRCFPFWRSVGQIWSRRRLSQYLHVVRLRASYGHN